MQKLAFFSVALLATLLATLFAQAATAEDSAAVPGTRWIPIIRALQDSGVDKVGDFDLTDFGDRAADIQWRSIDKAPDAVLSGSRKSAFYLSGEKKVFINDPLPAEAATSIPQLELHEAMGSLGYKDGDYSLSTAIATLSQLDSGPQRQELLKTYGQSLFKNSVMMGGTSVSGGGDLTTLYVKDQVLQTIMGGPKNRKAISSAFLFAYPGIAFEPLQDLSVTTVVIKYAYLVRPDEHGRQEVLSVFVPMSRCRQGEKVRRLLLQEIAAKLVQLFPAHPGQALRTFQPRACPSSRQLVSFPQTQDNFIADIQDYRGGVALGCQKMMPYQMDYSMMAPALFMEQEPAQAGHFYFNCQFIYHGHTIDYSLITTLGQGMAAAKNASLDGSDSIEGLAWVSADGRLTATGLKYVPANDHGPYKPPAYTVTKDPAQGKTQILVKGEKLAFQCKKAPR